MDVAENLGKSLFGSQRTVRGKDFEVILTVKVETRHPVGEHLAVSLGICNHCGVMTT